MPHCFDTAVSRHVDAADRIRKLRPMLEDLAHHLRQTIRSGRAIFWVGNSSSATEVQHFASALSGRFRNDRRVLISVSLPVGSSTVTAIAGDYDNLCAALQAARGFGAYSIAMTGNKAGRLSSIAHVSVRVWMIDTGSYSRASPTDWPSREWIGAIEYHTAFVKTFMECGLVIPCGSIHSW